MGARRQAFYKATKGRIAQLELALEGYYNDYRAYPPDTWLSPPPDLDSPNECLVYALTVVRPYIELKKLGRHDADGDDHYEIWDAWNIPLHYDSSSPSNNSGFVDIWSSGPDRDSSADGSGSPEDADNVTNWERD